MIHYKCRELSKTKTTNSNGQTIARLRLIGMAIALI